MESRDNGAQIDVVLNVIIFKVSVFITLAAIVSDTYSGQVQFSHLSIDDCLSQNAVFSIEQNNKGFMWFGTKDGLNRYDGRSFVAYQHNQFDEMRGKLTEYSGRTAESCFEGGPLVPDETELGDFSSMEYKPKLSVRTQKTGKSVTIEIEDNGSGIPDDIKNKIMQPFFTTKKGTQVISLGLSTTNDVVKAHGDTINIKTTEHEGTALIFELHV